MIAPDDMLVAAVAATLRRRARVRRVSSRRDPLTIARAVAAWKRVRATLCTGIRTAAV